VVQKTQVVVLGMVLVAGLLLIVGCNPVRDATPEDESPLDRANILLIVADDLGFTDLGSFGGEMSTPNLDTLARNGIRLSNFHSSASCAPTRSMLLSGTDNHLAGMGSQGNLATENQRGQPGYQNRISKTVKTVATSLKEVGYRTYMTGKWHLGHETEYLPGARGFDRSFVLLHGGASHFDETPLFPALEKAEWRLDDQNTTLPEDFYSSVDLTDRMIEFIESDEDQDSPFFAYLAYTAPHWPLQAPEELLVKHRGTYTMGYDELLELRMAGAIREGVVPTGSVAVKSTPGLKSWSELTPDQQAGYVARMDTYAAMVEGVDQNVGRLLSFLDEQGYLENTIIVFMSDNGAEGHAIEELPRLQNWLAENFDNTVANIGSRNSYVTTGEGWARAAMAPFRLTKARMSEGGIRVPAFIHFPDKNLGSIDSAYMTVMDLAPTFMEIANGPLSEQYRGHSLLTRLRGGEEPVHSVDETISFEVYGRRAVQRGTWKLLSMEPPYGTGEWELHNLEDDPGEQTDVALEFPAIVTQLSAAWESYAAEVGVIMPEHPISY